MLKYLLFVLNVGLFLGCSQPEIVRHYLDPEKSQMHHFYDLHAASYCSDKEMLKKLAHYKVIFVGDHHDQNQLHLKIASLIDALSKKRSVRLAAEWFTPEDAGVLKKFMANEISEKAFRKEVNWKKRVGFAYDSFKAIFEAVKKHQGKIVGINLSKEEQQKISKNDLKSMSKEEREFYQALDLKVQSHQYLVKPYFDHCHHYSKNVEDCFSRMYRVQVAWDSKMALEVFKQRQKLKDDEVLVVLAGEMHFYKKLGINLRFARLSYEPTFTLLPLSQTSKNVDIGIADGLILYEQQGSQKE
jgi:uncharacterized iron-regulated protein